MNCKKSMRDVWTAAEVSAREAKDVVEARKARAVAAHAAWREVEEVSREARKVAVAESWRVLEASRAWREATKAASEAKAAWQAANDEGGK